MNSQRATTKGIAIAIVVTLAMGCCLVGCSSAGTQRSIVGSTSASPIGTSQSTQDTYYKKTYSDIPTPYPALYSHDPYQGWLNVYDESKVIDYSQAANYVGQTVTVEGTSTAWCTPLRQTGRLTSSTSAAARTHPAASRL